MKKKMSFRRGGKKYITTQKKKRKDKKDRTPNTPQKKKGKRNNIK